MTECRDQVLEVFGDLACFSRPELKVERFSYPIMTPSAARGIFDAIYCKPIEFRWQVTKIEMLSAPSYIALRRNEVKETASEATVLGWATGRSEPEPIWADGEGDVRGRTQRQTMALKDARYRLHAEIRPWPGHEEKQSGLEAQFRRRAKHGKCFYQPYFGCREFVAYFELAEPADTLTQPVAWSADLGWMLYDVFDLNRRGNCATHPAISLFHAEVNSGVMDIPPYESNEVMKTHPE